MISDGTNSSEDDDDSYSEDSGDSDGERMSRRRIKKPRLSLGVKSGDNLIDSASAFASILNKIHVIASLEIKPVHCMHSSSFLKK